MSKTYSGTYTQGIIFTNFAVNNPVTVTGSIAAVAGRDGLRGNADYWTVSNSGLITSLVGSAIRLLAGAPDAPLDDRADT